MMHNILLTSNHEDCAEQVESSAIYTVVELTNPYMQAVVDVPDHLSVPIFFGRKCFTVID